MYELSQDHYEQITAAAGNGETLISTVEEIEQARAAYLSAFDVEDVPANNQMVSGRGKIHAMVRQYPEVAPLLGTLKLDAPMGFGSIEVDLPNDPRYFHVLLDAETFLAFALAGQIVLNEIDQPAYIGTERLRGE
jgi:hypothetical protein